MKIGMVSDSLASLTFEEMLEAAAGFGLDCLEFAMGAWSAAPHVDLDALIASDRERRELLSKVADRGLEISALNCSGNPLHPGPSGREHAAVTRKTIELAALLGIERVVLMSGLPAAPGDRYPQWITCAWPAETGEVLDYQWNEVVIPYWRELVAHAARHGIERLCVEMHGHQVVYNAPTLLRLREAVGPTVGANLDPSHLMWMGADPIATITALGDAIYHVHAKDTRLDPERLALTSRIETLPMSRSAERSWNYVTLGNGHGEEFWHTFCVALGRVGYHDVLSIEHEDVELDPCEGMRLSVELLRRAIGTPGMPNTAAS